MFQYKFSLKLDTLIFFDLIVRVSKGQMNLTKLLFFLNIKFFIGYLHSQHEFESPIVMK